MDRPPAPPEAVIIRLAREAAGIPVSDAAKRAGVSVARWSQIEAGSEMRRGAPRPVTGRAGTIARMAHAVPGISPERLETEGGRPDAAQILREILRDQAAADLPGAAVSPTPLLRKERLSYDQDGAAGLDPYIQGVRQEVYAALGLLDKFAADAELPAPWELPEVRAVLEGLPGAAVFAAHHEAVLWDVQAATFREREHQIAAMRKLVADWGRRASNAVLARA